MLNRMSRWTWVATAGLLVVVTVLIMPTFAQAPRDAKVAKAATPAPVPAGTAPATAGTAAPNAAAAPAGPMKIAVVDIDAVINGYNKFKVHNEDIRAQALGKQNELMKLVGDIKAKGEILQKLNPSSPDYKKHADEITEWQAKVQAKQEQYKNEFVMKDADGLATVYREVQDMVMRVARQRGYTMVLNSPSNKPISGSDPQSVMMAIARPVVYSDPGVDLTNNVIAYLNKVYKDSGGPEPKGDVPAAPGAPGAPGQSAAPAQGGAAPR